MYKNRDKQREANRQAQAKFKAKLKAEGIEFSEKKNGTFHIPLGKGITNQGITEKVLPERTAQGNIRVSKPGDDDYVPQCETTRAFIEDRPKRPETGKRGLDIKCFEDLPMDVQRTIVRMSLVDGKIDTTIKANRTAIAVNYQHLFPKRYSSTGVAR